MVVRGKHSPDLKRGDLVVPNGKNRLMKGVFLVLEVADMFGITQVVHMIDSNGAACEALNVELKKI